MSFAVTSDADRRRLLRIARDAIVAHVTGAPRPAVAEDGILSVPCGAFVTLHAGGALRGCIGHVEAGAPLGRTVARCAVAAATSDPRFHPLRAAELGGLQIELSVLGPLEPVSSIDQIEIGRHGVIIEQGRHRGLLLPQIATEWGWGAARFVSETCRKAGVPMDAWRRPDAAIFRFEADVFSESGPGQSEGAC